jgi:hypothetical protein
MPNEITGEKEFLDKWHAAFPGGKPERQPLSEEELLTFGLEYIAYSPPPEHGGFHPIAQGTAREALATNAALRAENDVLKRDSPEQTVGSVKWMIDTIRVAISKCTASERDCFEALMGESDGWQIRLEELDIEEESANDA